MKALTNRHRIIESRNNLVVEVVQVAQTFKCDSLIATSSFKFGSLTQRSNTIYDIVSEAYRDRRLCDPWFMPHQLGDTSSPLPECMPPLHTYVTKQRRRPDYVYMFPHMGRELVSAVATDPLASTFLVRIHEIFRSEYPLRFLNSYVQAKRIPRTHECHKLGCKAMVFDEPRKHGIDRVLRGAEDLCNLGRGPIFAIVG